MDRIILEIPQLDPEFVADQALAASPLIVECPIHGIHNIYKNLHNNIV